MNWWCYNHIRTLAMSTAGIRGMKLTSRFPRKSCIKDTESNQGPTNTGIKAIIGCGSLERSMSCLPATLSCYVAAFWVLIASTGYCCG